MELRQLDVTRLEMADIVSALELYRGVSTLRPDWRELRERMERYEVWGFYSGGKLIGFAWLRPMHRLLDRTVQLVQLRYHWQYNSEEAICQMMEEIAGVCRRNYKYLMLDVDIRHELNLELYRRLGFSRAIFPSPNGRGYAIYLAEL